MRKSEGFAPWMTGGVLLIVAAGLYLWAWAAAGEHLVFGGLLFNPLDGNTYLAKAYQGFAGAWRFVLPYTPDPGEGAYINLYYIFIGHSARVTGLPIPLTYHLFRLFGAGLMVAALWAYFRAVLPEGRAVVGLRIAVLTAGMGWLLIPSGHIPMDLWVAEAYPLLAALTNPHFPMAIGLALILANPVSKFSGVGRVVRDVALAFVLALVSPFAVVVAGLPWAGAAVAWVLEQRRAGAISISGLIRAEPVRRGLAILAGGLPVLIYDLLAIRADPVLAGWDAQNVAGSPAWWDLLLSLSPALVLAGMGFRRGPAALKGWLVMGLLLVVLPFSLQRRFLFALYVPIAGLAALGWAQLRARWLRVLIGLLFIPGPLLILMTGAAGVLSQNELLYFTRDEAAAFDWIEADTGPDDLVLAAPGTGLLIPAHTGRAVIYGHPFETVGADAARAAVEAFYSGMAPAPAAEWLAAQGVDYVFYGPREQALGALPDVPGLEKVFAAGEVAVYRVP